MTSNEASKASNPDSAEAIARPTTPPITPPQRSTPDDAPAKADTAAPAPPPVRAPEQARQTEQAQRADGPPATSAPVVKGDAQAAPTTPTPSPPTTITADTVAARAVVLDGADNGLVLTNFKTRAYTIGMNGGTSTISLANDKRAYTTVLDGQNGNLWAANNVNSRSLSANQVDLDGPNNHVKFCHSKTRTYTIGIDGEKSSMAFAHPDTRQYKLLLNGTTGDLWAANNLNSPSVTATNMSATNAVSSKIVAANQVDLDGTSNHIKFCHSKTRTYTVAISGDQSSMSFANPDTRAYTVVIDGVHGDISLSNADLAEEFDVADGHLTAAIPGAVLVIGETGALELADKPYDSAVAGVVSGAGSFAPAMVLDRQPDSDKRRPLALAGKVYCLVDATHGAVRPGDLLTTSPTRGHAMRVADPLKAVGAVLGKALGPLPTGRALLPILVTTS
ncbi:hypothetical protein C7C45_19735 [Micromonospora arborensis]|uniref:Uncharacterized protein n=1 Tax=Micromonospora arborensis TaxID=2116518 RepID=A0A318NGX4_9ACTN|nr:hypothetical protein [Micromonospora arborensis]PYC68131.1 hypothetical protein C7C45_19735 [Micromonospora arborensis]